MSLWRCVKRGRLQLLAGRSLSSAPATEARRCRGASFGQRCSSSVAGNKEYGTEDVSLKSVEDLPTPGNTWNMVWTFFFPADNFHEHALEASSSATGKLLRIPIPFLGHPFITTSSPKHVSDMFRNEGEVPFRPLSNHLEDFMVAKGFGKGLVIS